MISLSVQHRSFAVFQIATAATVVAFGIIHDQWVMSVSPDHFVEFHPSLLARVHPRLNTALLATIATAGPGLLLGCLLWIASARSSKTKSPAYAPVWRKLLVLLASVEAIAIATGIVSAWLFQRFGTEVLMVPAWACPEARADLVVAQTIQLYTYAAAAIGSMALLLDLWSNRQPDI